jgi:hypothetical protein
MTKIEVNDPSGNHIADFLWDGHDEQTSEKRQEFRQWVYKFLTENKGYEVAK